jgi:hypothetical protein
MTKEQRMSRRCERESSRGVWVIAVLRLTSFQFLLDEVTVLKFDVK